VVAIEDDVLDAGLLSNDESLQGEGALLAALKLPPDRTDVGHRRHHPAEQDRIIRAPLSGVTVVQGGPGTGKTAVALHRAAYLLYTHRDRLKSAGVLLVGPTDAFMKYIERVLPSLGETGVVMAGIGTLMPGIATVPESTEGAAALKGRLEMAQIIRKRRRQRQRIPAEPSGSMSRAPC
jgi:hypothetical protein